MLSGCSDGCNLDGDQRPADPDDSHCLRSRHAPGTSSYVPHTARLDLSTGHFTIRAFFLLESPTIITDRRL